MTVINGVEIDAINYHLNEIKYSIINNDPIEEFLNVILVISNPCLYLRRYILFKEFVKRMETEESNVRLYIVELIYPGQRFVVTESKNKNHLQLKADTVLWHKENMINLGVKKLLPKDYRAFAWVDADVEFENVAWATDTLKILNGCRDVVQLFSHCIDMDREGCNLNIFNGFGYSFEKGKRYTTKGIDYWHPGYAWAITRKAYERIGGLYDLGILGSGDNIMAMSFINCVHKMNNHEYHRNYNKSMLDFQSKTKGLRLGYTPGLIRHHYHGSKENRKYTQRWKILMKWKYDPEKFIIRSENGVIQVSSDFTDSFKNDIVQYFKERKEDY